MKKIMQYECECCGQIFDTESECEACEENHVKFIKDSVFMFRKGEAYPHVLRITFDDNNTAEYTMSRFL